MSIIPATSLTGGSTPEVEHVGRVATIVLSPRAAVQVTEDVGRTGLTGLTVHVGADSMTVPLTAPAVAALIEALKDATPTVVELINAYRGSRL